MPKQLPLDYLDILTSMISIAIAFGGLYLVYYRDVIERKVKRDAIVKFLYTNTSVLEYRRKLYTKLLPEIWRRNHQFFRVLLIVIGFIIPIIISVVHFKILNIQGILFSSFIITLIFLMMFYLLSIPILLSIEKLNLLLSDILRFSSMGVFFVFVISLFWIVKPPENFNGYQFFALFLSVSLLEGLFMYTLNQKEFNAFKSCSMACGEKEKRVLPVVRVFLNNGTEKKGKLIEFFDSDAIEIENEGQREFILWNKIDGIGFPTRDKKE